MTAGGILVRLEYLGREGWVKGHAGISLLNPERYVERLTERGKFGRATELDGMLQPTGRVWVSPNLPEDPSVLIDDPPYQKPRMPTEKDVQCDYCDTRHPAPWDGTCLL